jgi:hypothetical protein
VADKVAGLETGRCLCGSVSYKIQGEPVFVAHCHCQSCRRFSGGAVATYVGVLRSQVKFDQTEHKCYESAPGIRWGSCANCGTSLCYEADWCGDEIHLLIGTLDNPERFVPQKHSFYSERIAWLHLDENLPGARESIDQ